MNLYRWDRILGILNLGLGSANLVIYNGSPMVLIGFANLIIAAILLTTEKE